jgi:hypothetical protein
MGWRWCDEASGSDVLLDRRGCVGRFVCVVGSAIGSALLGEVSGTRLSEVGGAGLGEIGSAGTSVAHRVILGP